MSGDVQPRKRKDKRRKKDDEDAGTPPPTLVNPSSEHSTDNVTIHVHKEGGTGGHWCARIIFFALLTVLVGLVGLIIFENRGISDVDTPVASSRWAVIFDGWVDDILPQHDDEPHEEGKASEETDEHGEDETEEEDDDDHGDHDDDDDEEEVEEEEEEEEEETEEDVEDKDSAEVDKEEDEGVGSEEEGEEEENEADGSEADDDEDDDQQESVEEDNISRENAYEESREAPDDDGEDDVADEKYDDEKSDEGFNEPEDFEDDAEDFGTLEEVDNGSEEEGDKEDDVDDDAAGGDEDDEEEANNVSDNDLDFSIEGVRASKEREDDDMSREFFSIPGEIDDNSAEPLEEIEDGELEEVVNELEIEPDEEEEPEEESTSVAVKFGVGVALIVAAHFVLVRRWNNVEAELAGSYGDEVLDLSRRNTIIPPINPKDLIASASEQPVPEEKVVESYEELRAKYKGLEVDSPELMSVKKTLGKIESLQLKNTSFQDKGIPEGKKVTQQKEEEVEEMQTSESERLSATEPEEEDEEEEDDEEEEATEEDEEEDEEEAEDVDDSELVAKLEAKYGKLPTPTESEEEEEEDDDYDEEEEEEDDEDAEEDDEEIQGWKRVKAPKGGHSESASGQRQEARGKEAPAPKGRQGASGSAGGKRAHEYVNDSSMDEVSIQEETHSWQPEELDN